jgi:hypothetical protein
MKSTWRRWLIGGFIGSFAAGALMLWQTPVLVRLPFRKAYIMYRHPDIEVRLDGRPAPQIGVFGSSAPGNTWPELLVLTFPDDAEGVYGKILLHPAEGIVGQSNDGPDYYQNLGPLLIRSDAAGLVNLYTAKTYDGDPQFERAVDRLTFRLPHEYKPYPGTTVEIRKPPRP